LDQRNAFVAEAVRHAAFNFQSAVLTWGGSLQKAFRIFYALAIGDRAFPGAVRMVAACLRGEREVVRAFIPSQSGQWQSLRRMLAGRSARLRSDGASPARRGGR
jgi:hypothetical protein